MGEKDVSFPLAAFYEIFMILYSDLKDMLWIIYIYTYIYSPWHTLQFGSHSIHQRIYSGSHSGIHKKWLSWTAMFLRPQLFYCSDVKCPFRSQVLFITCSYFRVHSVECWWFLRNRSIRYLSCWKIISYLIDKMTRRVLPLLKVKWN
jgi:hypothetical protein